MSTALQIVDGGNKRQRRKAEKEKAVTRPHCKVSIDDVNWVRQQPPCVQQLWLDCIAAEQYGGAAHKLDTNLSRNSFIKASAVINGAGLFEFEEVRSKTQSGRSGVTGFRVKNLHGYFNRHYWENFDNQPLTPESQAVTAENQQLMPETHQMMPECQVLTFSEAQTNTQQEFQNTNYGTNHPLTTYQQPTKVVGMVVGSDAPFQNLCVNETAHAPKEGGASPPHIECASELEESPTAMDCTTLALVDSASSQSATLSTENQVSGVEQKDLHEDTSSLRVRQFGIDGNRQDSDCLTVAQHEQNFTNTEILNILDAANQGVCPSLEAIAVLLKTPHARSLMGVINSNPQWGIKLSDYSTVPQDFKLRQERLNRLKSYAAIGESPPDEFLLECQSDPVLAIQILRMVARENWDIQRNTDFS